MSNRPDNFKLNDPYQVLAEEEIYNEDQWIGKIFGVYHKNKEQAHLRFMSMSSHGGWGKRHGFNIRSPAEADKVVNAIRRVSDAINWEITEQGATELRRSLQEKDRLIQSLRTSLREREQLIQRLKQEKEEYVRTRADEFEEDCEKLEEKIERAADGEIPEEKAQEFLKENPWLFGTEYADTQPKKLAGSDSEFDFYLTRYDNKNVIIELKRISDDILRKDGSIRSDVVQAVDQCMGYMEKTQAIAHSTQLSEDEDIEERRPRGIIVIGHDTSEDAKEKLKSWSYSLNNIELMTYSTLLSKATTTLENLQEDKNNQK